jgi:hypothetical protein
MFDIAVGAFALFFATFALLLILGTPMIRSTERRCALNAGHDELKRLRGERATARGTASDVLARRDDASAKLAKMRSELHAIEDEIKRLPDQVFELTFELGAPQPGMQSFDFIVSRHANNLASSSVSTPERNLWRTPRVVRVLSRNQAQASAALEKRFRPADGFSTRLAERRLADAAVGG